jgi:capsular polysaccharide biosynthesis protein
MLEHELGFETLVMSSLSLDEQVRAFREASVVVGAHGPAVANLRRVVTQMLEDTDSRATLVNGRA